MISREDLLKAMALPGFRWGEGMVLDTGEDTPQWILLNQPENPYDAYFLRSDLKVCSGSEVEEQTEGCIALRLSHPSNDGHLLRLLGDVSVVVTVSGLDFVTTCHGHKFWVCSISEQCVRHALRLGRWPGGMSRLKGRSA